MFPLSSFCDTASKALGFDAFFLGDLHDIDKMVYDERLAFFVPQTVFDEKSPQLLTFLTYLISRFGYVCVASEWRKSATYENDHHGSRFRTHVFGPHILFTIAECPTKPQEGDDVPPLPVDRIWTVITVSCDSLKKEGDCVSYLTYYYSAAFPEDVDSTKDSLVAAARKELW